MDEQLIFFVDFLGFEEAVRDKAKTGLLIALLHDLAALRADFDLTENPVEGGGTQFRVTPAITTFSDHVVMSCPIEQIRKFGGDDTVLGLRMAQRLIGALAASAMNLGLLIRGGATVGPLHHSGGVVLGEAMNEAYRLESTVSIYPRIAVSRKVYSTITLNPRSMWVLDDDDGITHFNYFSSMIRAGGRQGADYKQTLNAWLAQARHTIAANIATFERNERWNELAKWVWFRNHLEQARAGMNNAVFE